MKATSIIKIEEMLRQKRETAHAYYKSIRSDLRDKYGTEWLDSEITKDEKIKLHSQKQVCNEMDDLYEDFMNHQW